MAPDTGQHREPGADGAQALGRGVDSGASPGSLLGRGRLRRRFLVVGVFVLVSLGAGTAGFLTGRRVIEAVVALASLLALGLLLALYLSIATPIRRMATTLRGAGGARGAPKDDLDFIASELQEVLVRAGQARAKLSHEATHDVLTGLANRAHAFTQLERLLGRVRKGSAVAVLLIDLDGFKPVNDTLGHEAGDQVLQAMAERLLATARPTDLVARLAGDEFLVGCDELAGADSAVLIAERLASALSDDILIETEAGSRIVKVGVSIGVRYVSERKRTAEEMIRDADAAMYRAKGNPDGSVELFGEQLREEVGRRARLGQALHGAVANDELEVRYQPIVDLVTMRVVGLEALVRWRDAHGGFVPPGEFIRYAEESRLIAAIGSSVLRTACQQLGAWREPVGQLEMAVNVSARELTDPGLLDTVGEVIAGAAIPPGALCLELTETALLSAPTAAAETLVALRAMGVRLALDDFGTGYSSLRHLVDFPLDVIKLNHSLVAGLRRGPDEAVVRAGIALAATFDLTVVAKGIETPDQYQRLRTLGCDAGQGYLFARPAAPEELADILAQGRIEAPRSLQPLTRAPAS